MKKRDTSGGRLVMFDVFVGALASVLVLWAISITQQSRAEPQEPSNTSSYGLQLRIVAVDEVTLRLRIVDARSQEQSFLLKPDEGCYALAGEAQFCGRRADEGHGIAYYFSAPTAATGTWSYQISYYEPPAANPTLRTVRIRELAHLDGDDKLQTCGRGEDVMLGASFPAKGCPAVVGRSLQGFVPGLPVLPR